MIGRRKRLDDFDDVILRLMKTPCHTIHPRAANRSRTLWSTAVTVSLDDKLPDVLETLSRENILGAPVVAAEDDSFMGFIDMNDIVVYTVSLFDIPLDRGDLTEFFSRRGSFRNCTVREVLDRKALRDTRRFVLPLRRGFSLLYGLEMMARTGERRVAVLGNNDRVTGVVTNSMVIGWLRDHLDDFGDARDIPVRNIHTTYFTASINQNSRAIDAFRLMAEQGLTGIAVIDDKGVLVDNISVRDLRGIGPDADMFLRLFEKIVDFKKAIRRNVFGQQIPEEPITVLPTDTLEKVITLMDTNYVHRVYVIASPQDRRPLHVISQADILRYVLPDTAV